MNAPHLTAYDRLLDTLAERGYTVQTTGARTAKACCPAHNDRTPSLGITNGETRVLVRCHAGCATPDVMDALGLRMADLFNEPGERPVTFLDPWMPCADRNIGRGHVKVAEYPYNNPDGTFRFGVARCDHKCFAQWKPDPTKKSGRAWNLRDVDTTIPYRLPELTAAIRGGDGVIVVEGEKDVHTLHNRGMAATCNNGGAEKWTRAHGIWLAGADVTVWADRDEPGKRHARLVVATLLPHANSITVVQSRHGKDATDHLTHPDGHLGNTITVWEPKPYPLNPAGTA